MGTVRKKGGKKTLEQSDETGGNRQKKNLET